MTSIGKFTVSTIETLARRAAFHCSNPDCCVLTTGPTASDSGAINIGEAAHIYGRTEGSARFNITITPAMRGDIINGVWLCRNCHKKIDNDAAQFPAELLFEWRREHEHATLERLGRKGDLLREKLRTQRLEPFRQASYLAQQIVLDRPPFWEYKLTVELLRPELGALHTKWQEFKNRLYTRKSTLVPFEVIFDWYRTRFDDLSEAVDALQRLISTEISKAWGDPGIPGIDTEILRVCKLIVAVAENLLQWEEEIRFSHVPDEFSEMRGVLEGVAGQQIEEMMRIPNELAKVFQQEEHPEGVRTIELVFKVPDNFVRNHELVLERCSNRYLRRKRLA